VCSSRRCPADGISSTTSDPIEYRACTEADIEAVLALWRRADLRPSPTDDAAALRVRLRRDAALLLLAVADGKVVGSLIGGWDGWRGNMYRLAVDPDYRRRDVARGLTERVERTLRSMGARRITSLVQRDEAAIGFWEDASYHVDRDVERYAKDLQ
jgi:ribosomal protein S18 acetylase RimI-like enzyme